VPIGLERKRAASEVALGGSGVFLVVKELTFGVDERTGLHELSQRDTSARFAKELGFAEGKLLESRDSAFRRAYFGQDARINVTPYTRLDAAIAFGVALYLLSPLLLASSSGRTAGPIRMDAQVMLVGYFLYWGRPNSCVTSRHFATGALLPNTQHQSLNISR
jgi:hypothetical protein